MVFMKHPDKQRIIFFSVISQGGRKRQYVMPLWRLCFYIQDNQHFIACQYDTTQ